MFNRKNNDKNKIMNKEKEIQPVEETQVKEKVEVWDMADLCVKCYQCGAVIKVATIEKGTDFVMPTTSDATIELFCPSCESKMALFYENGEVLPHPELTEEEEKLTQIIRDESDDPVNDLDKEEKTFEEKMQEIADDKTEKLKAEKDESQKESIK